MLKKLQCKCKCGYYLNEKPLTFDYYFTFFKCPKCGRRYKIDRDIK